MKSFTDQEILDNVAKYYQYSRDSSKEGKGTNRGAGMSGLTHAEWIRWRVEARKRGLIPTIFVKV